MHQYNYINTTPVHEIMKFKFHLDKEQFLANNK